MELQNILSLPDGDSTALQGSLGSWKHQRQLSKWMDAWEAGTCSMLLQDTEQTALAQLAKAQGSSTPEQKAKVYARLVV